MVAEVELPIYKTLDGLLDPKVGAALQLELNVWVAGSKLVTACGVCPWRATNKYPSEFPFAGAVQLRSIEVGPTHPSSKLAGFSGGVIKTTSSGFPEVR